MTTKINNLTFERILSLTSLLLVGGVLIGHLPASGGYPPMSPLRHFLSEYPSTGRFGWGILVAMVCYAVLLALVALRVWKSGKNLIGKGVPSLAFGAAALLMLVVAFAPARPIERPDAPPPSVEERAETDRLQHIHDVAIFNSMRLQWLGMAGFLVLSWPWRWHAGWPLFAFVLVAFFLLPGLNPAWPGLWQRIGLGAMVAWLAWAGGLTGVPLAANVEGAESQTL